MCVAALVASAGIWSSAQGPAAGGQGAPAGAPGSVQGTPAQDTAKGAALLAEARKALGGEDRFKAVQRLEAKGKSVRAQAQTNLEGDFEYLFELPDKFRRNESISLGNAGIDLTQILSADDVFEEASFAGGGGGIGGFDGGDGGDFGGRGGRGGRGGGRMGNIAGLLGGTVATGGDPEAQKDAQRRAIGSEMARLMAAILLTSSEPVAWIGVAESPDGKADVLEFRAPDGVPTRLLIDASTHMPLMLTWAGTPAAADFGGRGGRFGNRGGGPAAPDAARGQGGEPGQAQGRRGGRGGGQVPMQLFVSDYKTVNGIRLPHLIQRGANGETTEEFVVRSYRINPSFKADTFKK